MRFTALALLAATAHALTPSRKIKVARKNTLDSSVTFDEYQSSAKTTGYALDEPAAGIKTSWTNAS